MIGCSGNGSTSSKAGDSVRTMGAHQATFKTVSAQLTETMLECPARVWPNYDWKNYTVLFLEKDQPTKAWSGQTGQVTDYPESQIPESSRGAFFAFADLPEGKALTVDASAWVGIALTETSLFDFIVHEGFHHVGQRNWTRKAGRSRGTLVPLKTEPRIYRRMLYQRLEDYFLSKGANKKALAQAALWFKKWSTEYPKEVASTMDGSEGTARYVESTAEALAVAGCGSTEDQLRAEVTKIMEREIRPRGVWSALDSEGYSIGGLAGFILRFQQKDESWHQKVTTGATPVEILLADVNPEDDVADAEISKLYDDAISLQNALIGIRIDHDVDLYQKAETIRVSIPYGAGQGSYSPHGFYLPEQVPGVTAIPLAEGSRYKSGSWEVTVKESTVLFTDEKTPCTPGYVVALEQTQVQVNGARATLASSLIQGSIEGEWKTDESNRKFFCGSLTKTAD